MDEEQLKFVSKALEDIRLVLTDLDRRIRFLEVRTYSNG